MKLRIKFSKLRQEISFTRHPGYYIYLNLNGKSASVGKQISSSANLSGNNTSICVRGYEGYWKIMGL